jgi:16S rRNA processing protein RimM
MADSARAQERLLVGRIGGAHGIKGEVRIQSFTADPLALIDYSPLETGMAGRTVVLEAARATATAVIARLRGVTTRNEAEALNGVDLFVPRDRLPSPADEDDFYIADLVGLKARLVDGTELGRIVAVPNYGAGDILEIRDQHGATTLFPFTRAAVPEVNLAEGYALIDPPADIEPAGNGGDDTTK